MLLKKLQNECDQKWPKLVTFSDIVKKSPKVVCLKSEKNYSLPLMLLEKFQNECD